MAGFQSFRRVLRALRALVCAAIVLAGPALPATAAPRDAVYFTNLPLVTSDGREVAFFDDLLKDRIVVVNFFYTRCTDMCSLTTARLAQLYDWLSERMGRDVFFVSITLDPEHDTPEVLADFAASFGAGKGWTFVTGTRDNIDTIRFKLGEKAQALALHRTDMVIGNAATGVWRRSSAMGSLTIALQSILELDPAYRDATQAEAAALTASLDLDTSYDLSAHPGEAIFLSACASCHTIGLGTRFGPDLAAVTLRRERDWLEAFIMDPDLVLASGDPIAEALAEDFPGVVMPNLGLNPVDVADLLSYLEAHDARLAKDEADAAASYAAFEAAHVPAEETPARDEGWLGALLPDWAR